MMTPNEARSRTMRAVRSKDTTPEIIVRKLVHEMGYRYRLHKKNLPGSPDLVFAGKRRIIFVHGCFWHGHDCKRGARQPKANAGYWRQKIEKNRIRDVRISAELVADGWRLATIWECEIRDRDDLKDRLRAFLNGSE